MEIREMRAMLGESQQKFGDRYDIPLRTIQQWESGERKCPVYVAKLLERAVLEDKKKQWYQLY